MMNKTKQGKSPDFKLCDDCTKSGIKLLLSLLILVSFSSCANYTSVSSARDDKQSYDFELNPVHPLTYIYHSSDDSTQIYTRVRAKELLYVRESPDSSFKANLRIDAYLKGVGDQSGFSDSSVHYLSGIAETGIAVDLEYSFSLFAPSGRDYSLELIVSDLNRKMYSETKIFLYKGEENTVQDYLLINKETNSPLYNFISDRAIDVLVKSDRLKPELLFVSRYPGELGLPPPPFSDAQSTTIPLPEGRSILMEESGSGWFSGSLSSGLFFISPDENAESGVALSITNESYPFVKTPNEMAKTVRYITSRVEYDNLNLGHDIKPKIDKFWIECASDEERAKDLIAMYYNRVEEANFYFTSTIPGWKTDRGLIHIVYGNPKKIYRFADQETWLYGEEDNLSSTRFNFIKQSDGFSDNQFKLTRDHIYRTSWERAVTGWRNGRVFSD